MLTSCRHCIVLAGSKLSFFPFYKLSLSLSPKMMLSWETVMLQFASGIVHFFSIFFVARYISFKRAISEVKAPLVLVTLRIWRWYPSIVLVVYTSLRMAAGYLK